MSIPDFCEKCIELREAEIATPLLECTDKEYCLEVRLCEYHCYEMYGMCSICLNFIQDPANDQRLAEWESKMEKRSETI